MKHHWLFSPRRRVEQLLRIDPDSKPRVYKQVFDAAEFADLNYGLELSISAGIATFGLVLNSPAVVIGAMLISPLMGPILAAGLSLAAADLYLGIKSLASLGLSIVAAVAFSAGLVWLLPFQMPTAEILARTTPNLLDLGVALLSGIAGSLVVCRGGGGGGVTALPGVAIAVALMPPLCTVGFGVGSGFDWAIISGAGLLFLTNLAAIVASAFLIFYAVRMDAPDVRQPIEAFILERAAGDRLYEILDRTGLHHAFGRIGKLHWRILMLVVVLGVLFVPLSNALMQVRDVTIARNAVRDALRQLAPPDTIVGQQIEFPLQRIVVRLVVTDPVAPDKIRDAERTLLRRTGRDVSLSVRKVAGEEELMLLRERLRAPAPPPPPSPLEDLNTVRAELLARLERPLHEVWPAAYAPLVSYELGMTPESLLVRLRYKAEKPLEEAFQEAVTRILQARLGTEKLKVVLEQEQEPPPEPPARNPGAKKK